MMQRGLSATADPCLVENSSGQQATDDVVIVGPSVYYPVYFVGLLEELSLTPFDAFLMKNETYDLKVASQVTPAVRNFL